MILIAFFHYTAHNSGLFSIDETLSSLEKRASEFQARHSDSPPADVPEPMSVTFTDQDDPFAIGLDSQRLGHINSMSGFQWVGCGDGIFVIELVGKGFIRIEQPQGMEAN